MAASQQGCHSQGRLVTVRPPKSRCVYRRAVLLSHASVQKLMLSSESLGHSAEDLLFRVCPLPGPLQTDKSYLWSCGAGATIVTV